MAADPNLPERTDRTSRRAFVTDVGRLASVVALSACAGPHAAEAAARPAPIPTRAGSWDLSWVDRLAGVTNRAVFDWPNREDPPEAIALDYAARFLDGVAAAYGANEPARAVVVIRAAALPAALSDAAWARFPIGTEYNVKDPTTNEPAVRNPFWRGTPGPSPDQTPPSLQDVMQRGAMVLVCNLALMHTARRLAAKLAQNPEAVHRELLTELVPGAYVVPSGVFGVIRAQNAGCAFMRA